MGSDRRASLHRHTAAVSRDSARRPGGMASVASVARWLVGCVSLRGNPESGGMKHAILHFRPPPGQSPRRSNWQSCFFRVSLCTVRHSLSAHSSENTFRPSCRSLLSKKFRGIIACLAFVVPPFAPKGRSNKLPPTLCRHWINAEEESHRR
jgi:hypothetical protein